VSTLSELLSKQLISVLGAPSARRRETPRETGGHHGEIAGDLGVVAILRAPLVELRDRLRQRETGEHVAVGILPGSKEALVELRHALQHDGLVVRPLQGQNPCRVDMIWGHSMLFQRERRPRPAPPDQGGSGHSSRGGHQAGDLTGKAGERTSLNVSRFVRMSQRQEHGSISFHGMTSR
jgi:hypothetical protein